MDIPDRGRIVALLRRASRTVDQLAAALGLTDDAVRLHLGTLERDGVVRAASVRRDGGVGKPATLYKIAPEAEPGFSNAYLPFLVTLLDRVGDRLGEEEMRALMRDVGHRRAAVTGVVVRETAGRAVPLASSPVHHVAMSAMHLSLDGRVAVVTGGYGVLGGTLASGLAAAGARVAILGRRRDAAEAKAAEIGAAGGEATALVADALDERQVLQARDELLARWGRVDILVNAAGGNVPASRNDDRSIFDVPMDAFDEVLRLNLHGTVVPSMAFGAAMAERRRGAIVNISSMAAVRALSGVLGYSVAKTGVDAFTRWMAVEMARKHGEGVRVNAIAPGFFVAEQNRAVLLRPDGSYTPRAERIVAQTPMGRFGRPEELVGAVTWLCSDAASFVTGVVLPVDGGFSVFSGV